MWKNEVTAGDKYWMDLPTEWNKMVKHFSYLKCNFAGRVSEFEN